MKKSNKSLTKNTLFYILYNFLNIIFPFLTGIYAARVLLPNSIGMVESAKNFVTYFSILSFLGIPTYGLREISKYRNNHTKLNKIYSELFVINFISTLFFCIFYFSLLFIIPECSHNFNLYLIVGLLIFLNFFNNSWLYEGLEEFGYISIRNLAFKIISFLCLIIFVRNDSDYLWYASITVIGTAGNYILNIINAKKYVKFSIKDLNLKRHMKSIVYLVFVNLAIEIYTLVDITMLSILCDKSNVAYYSYGIKIYRILIQVINTFTIVIVPRIALLYNENKMAEFNRLLSKTCKIILIVGVPIIIGIWFTSDFFICLLYGDNYISSSYVLKTLSFALIISPIGYLLGSRVMLASGNEKKMVIPVTFGAIINVILNFIFIQLFKEIGAAIASAVSEFAVMLIYILLSKKYFKLVDIKKSILNILISSAILFIYLFFMSYICNSLYLYIVDVLLAVILYFGILFLLKDEEIRNIYLKIIKKAHKS